MIRKTKHIVYLCNAEGKKENVESTKFVNPDIVKIHFKLNGKKTSLPFDSSQYSFSKKGKKYYLFDKINGHIFVNNEVQTVDKDIWDIAMVSKFFKDVTSRWDLKAQVSNLGVKIIIGICGFFGGWIAYSYFGGVLNV